MLLCSIPQFQITISLPQGHHAKDFPCFLLKRVLKFLDFRKVAALSLDLLRIFLELLGPFLQLEFLGEEAFPLLEVDPFLGVFPFLDHAFLEVCFGVAVEDCCLVVADRIGWLVLMDSRCW